MIDESSIRSEKDSQTLNKLELQLITKTLFIASSNSDLNSLQSEMNKKIIRILKKISFIKTIEYTLIFKNSIIYHLNDISTSFISHFSISKEVKE